MPTQYGFFLDSSKCTGCKTCQVSCKDEKDLDVGPKLRRVYEYVGGAERLCCDLEVLARAAVSKAFSHLGRQAWLRNGEPGPHQRG